MDIALTIQAASETAAEDVRRCLAVLYGTTPGEQALDRDFGIDQECLAMPPAAAQALFAAEIVKKTAQDEPRARVARVEWEESDAQRGELRPRVVIELV